MTNPAKILRLVRFSLTTANADHLATFYKRAFGCHRIADYRLDGDAFRRLAGVESGARCIELGLGDEVIELLEFDTPGRPYPFGTSASTLSFQHFAIVAADMTEAWFQLSRIQGWSPITHGLPQRLPEPSGGVTAFKFRDPEGHPLELLSFPPARTPQKWQRSGAGRRCLGIDHSAISIKDAVASRTFYEELGLQMIASSLNAGPEQDALDGITSSRVDVVALSPEVKTPHLELLCYQNMGRQQCFPQKNNDIACTRLVFESCDADGEKHSQAVEDPDGHHLIIRPSNS